MVVGGHFLNSWLPKDQRQYVPINMSKVKLVKWIGGTAASGSKNHVTF